MEEKEVIDELLKEEKIFQVLRTLHQLLHLYDINQKFEKFKPIGGVDVSKLKDSVSVILKDKEGKIKTR